MNVIMLNEKLQSKIERHYTTAQNYGKIVAWGHSDLNLEPKVCCMYSMQPSTEYLYLYPVMHLSYS